MEDNKKQFEKELKYLVKEEIDKEIIKHQEELKNKDTDIKSMAKQIYLERGIDYNKLNKDLLNNLMNDLESLGNSFKIKDSKVKRRMVLDIVYMVVILVLMRIPFEFVCELGYDFIEILTTNNILQSLWELAFLLLYTITALCSFILLIRQFKKRYCD